MIHSTKVAKRYAKALLDYAIENQKEELLFGEISSVVEVIHENPDLKALLHSPSKQKLNSEYYKKSSLSISLNCRYSLLFFFKIKEYRICMLSLVNLWSNTTNIKKR